MAGDFDGVDEPGLAYKAMAKEGRWDLLQALESTLKMIEGGTKWLPKFEKEQSYTYDARLNRNFLYAMFSQAVSTNAAKPFSTPITIGGDVELPRGLAMLEKDMDGRGTSLSAFIGSYFESGVRYGLGHALTDYTTLPQNTKDAKQGANRATLGEEQKQGARAKVIEISAPNLIDWDDKTINGKQVLTEIRFRGSRTERKGFKQRRIRTVTHYRDDVIDFYESSEKDKWEKLKPKENTLRYVPLETWYAKKTGFMTAKPPFLALAETNLNHWQFSSDYNALVTIVSMSPFFTKGFSKQEAELTSIIGPARRIHAKETTADAKWVEHSGAGLESIEKALQKLEDRAASLSSKPTSRDKSAVTATGEKRDASDAICDLLSWVGVQEDAIRGIYGHAAKWMKEEVPEDFTPKIYRGFTIGSEAQEEMRIVQNDADKGRITSATCLKEGKRRGIYGSDMDPDAEVADAHKEASEKMKNGIDPSDEDFEDEAGSEAA